MHKVTDHHPEREQIIGATVSVVNEELTFKISEISNSEFEQILNQNNALRESLNQVEKIRDFLGAPEHILGNQYTKHGEIAENIEVNIRNARDILEQRLPNATFEGVGRTAPTDYIIGDTHVQSKFIAGLPNTLDHVIDHMNKYQEIGFGRDGSFYHIPKDFHAEMTKIIDGEYVGELSSRKIQTILSKVSEVEALSGKPFSEVVQPSISSYREVQQGVVFKTVDGHEEQILSRNQEIIGDIKHGADQERYESYFQAGGKAAAYGAAIGAFVGVGLLVYKKHKSGKSLSNFNTTDWKDVGVEFSKGGLKGGVTGLSIYGMTNFLNFNAPLASAFVSASFGIANLSYSYKNGDISLDDFADQAQVLCFDTSVIALSATMGQALIPVPILGTLIGSFAGRIVLNISKEHLGADTDKLQKVYDMQFEKLTSQLDRAYKIKIQEIIDEFEKIGGIRSMAFDYNQNSKLRFEASVRLSYVYSVDESKILMSKNDIDNYFYA
jgi:hypothetical protein